MARNKSLEKTIGEALKGAAAVAESLSVMGRCRTLFDRYKPKLEELYNVDLSEVELKNMDRLSEDWDQYLWDEMEQEEWWKPEEERSNSEKVIYRISHKFTKKGFEFGARVKTRDAVMTYLRECNTVYVDTEKARDSDDQTLAGLIVHELAHAVEDHSDHTMDTSRHKPRALLTAMVEGFAMYVSLDSFADLYEIEGMDSLSREIGEGARKDVAQDIHHSMGIPGGKRLHSQLKPYLYGFVFFEKIARKGIDPLYAFDNPPENYDEIRFPAKYIRRVKAAEK